MSKIKSVCICPFCKKDYAKRSISRHLETHLKKLPSTVGKTAVHLRIEAGPFFLNLLMNGNSTLNTLDSYLRKIWLECCGHLSQFSIGGTWGGTQIGKSRKIKDLLGRAKKLNYVYDFGSSTELDVKIIGAHSIAIKGSIELLTRNEPLEMLCHFCDKNPAVKLCSVHIYETEGFAFCKTCSKKHEAVCPDAADYAWLSVCNSPRMGVCAYEGGMIDLERDGVFKI